MPFTPSQGRRDRTDVFLGVLAALAIALPPLWLGPWLPLPELAGRIALQSYPAGQSQGPLHYYVFQFTHIGDYVLSRFLQAWGLGAPAQILVGYLLRVLGLFGVVYLALGRLVDSPWLRGVGAVIGSLACWDALFLRGGPPTFSLAALLVAMATLLSLREAAEPGQSTALPVGLLCVLALTCHPLALLFTSLLATVRLIFLPVGRWRNVALLAVLLLGGLVISREAPPGDGFDPVRLPALFGFSPGEMGARVAGLFTDDPAGIRALYGFLPGTFRAYLLVLAVIQFAGFLLAPFLVLQASQQPALRFLGALNAAVGLFYLFSTAAPDNPVPDWPQRILSFHSSVTFLTGFAGLLWLYRREGLRPWSDRSLSPLVRWPLPLAGLALIVTTQVPLLSLSRDVERNVGVVRDELLRTSVRNALVVVTDVDAIQPPYLRAVPYILFSDPRLVEQNLLLHTDWHQQARHPHRLAESWFDLGRARHLARFASDGGVVRVRLDARTDLPFPSPGGSLQPGAGGEETQAFAQFARGMQLYGQGATRDAIGHFQAAVRLKPDWSEALNNLGACLINSGRAREALPHLEAALRLTPESTDLELNLAAALLAADDRKAAAARLEAFLRTHPDSPRARDLARQAGLPP